MRGREAENRKRSRHMLSVPSRGTIVSRIVAGDSSKANSFCKDGRKINVGDCALFKPPQDSPTFIGIIRCLKLNKEHNLHLGVNWLYRPAEVKFCKGVLPDAAPNEVFYSFHKDEIPAASLLHPCKVAFLPKGVELPSGISSFVCRRVYDIANKCLWWLTDQDYINERQEEVGQLLDKTRVEMHATVQPGGRSPKPIHGPTSASQLKPGSDNRHVASFPFQAKGKKRERADQGSERVKRERSSKTDDCDSGHLKPESTLKSEISKITEKGGLFDPEGVDKLAQLMQSDRAERMISRSMLAGVIAATEKFDCLSRFVQLKGLTVLDEWLQDVHKGKIRDGSPKDDDTSTEEFLLVLLRALDRLPVNLHALQMCNIGKSVNHLRSHKNLDIQKKARSLVDTWKKRVEAEMNMIDAKSGSTQAVWPSRSRVPEVTVGGSQNLGGSSELVMKSSVSQLSEAKAASVKPVQVEITAKFSPSSPRTVKSTLSPASGKDGHPRIVVGSTCDLPSTIAREERSSSSSQSHSSRSYSSDNAKTTAFSGKEDARGSISGSLIMNVMSVGSSRHQSSINGFPGHAFSVSQGETGSSRSFSLQRNSAPEKLSESGLTCEKASDVPDIEGNSHRLIVKIPNKGRSPAQSASGGLVDDPSNMKSRAASPVLSEKHGQSAWENSGANATSDVNAESWQSNDFKDVLTGSDDGDGSPTTIPEEEQCRAGDNAAKIAEVPRVASSSSGNYPKLGKLCEASFSSRNAFVESGVSYSEPNESLTVGEDVGMDLLASVAAGEMPKSDLFSPSDSPGRNSPTAEDLCRGDAAKSESSHGNSLAREQSTVVDVEKQGIAGASLLMGGLHDLSEEASGDICGNGKVTSSVAINASTGEGNYNELNPSDLDLQSASERCLEIIGRSDELEGATSVVSAASVSDKIVDAEESKQFQKKAAAVSIVSADSMQGNKPMGSCSTLTDVKVNEVLSIVEVEKHAVGGPSSGASSKIGVEIKNHVNEVFNGGDHSEKKPHLEKVQCEHLERNDEHLLHDSGSRKHLPLGIDEELNGGIADEINTRSHSSEAGKRETGHGTNMAPVYEDRVLAGLGSAVGEKKSEGKEEKSETKDVLEHCSGGVVPQESPASPGQELQHHFGSGSSGSKMTGVEADETEESAPIAEDGSSFPAAGVSDTDTKLKFDLNEGFAADEGKYGEPINLAGSGRSASVHLLNPLPFPVSSVSSGLPASITVAAAAKGPFVPPEDLLQSKGDLGWKGSAATSAFRPAESRKVLEMALGATDVPLPDSTAGKHGRPLLDIDLNEPGERILEDLASRNSAEVAPSKSDRTSKHDFTHNTLMSSSPVGSSGGIDLDLNRADEASDMGQCSTSGFCELDASLFPFKSSLSSGFPNCEARGFDLNNGPVLDEASAGPSLFNHQGRSRMQSQPLVAGVRMNNAETVPFLSWLPTGNTYSAVTIPSILSDRGDRPFPIVATGGAPRMLVPPTGGTPCTPDVYRGSVLSSSPAVPISSTPFQYPVFPFGTSLSLPSPTCTTYMDSSSESRLCFPPVNSQLLGPAAIFSSHYPRPYAVNIPDGINNSGADNNRKWSRQGLDLNAGPGSVGIEGRVDKPLLSSRQLSVASPQALAEEQARMYHQVASGVLKRKEPEGEWDTESYRYKPSSWQ